MFLCFLESTFRNIEHFKQTIVRKFKKNKEIYIRTQIQEIWTVLLSNRRLTYII